VNQILSPLGDDKLVVCFGSKLTTHEEEEEDQEKQLVASKQEL